MGYFRGRADRGFTLVELLVVMAIIGIVGGAITSFIVVSQKNYNSGTDDVDLQYEAQLAANQLQDLMIDTARGISYSYCRELAEGTEDQLVADDSQIRPEDVVTTKSLYIYNEDKYYRLLWDPATAQIRFFTYDVSAPGTPEGAAGGELLAEFVTGFSVDLRDVACNRTVKYVITFTKAGTGRSYTTSHKLKLRNEVLVNASMDTIYVPDAPDPVADGISVSPSQLWLWPGESSAVSATVTSSGGAVPSQSVAWRISGASDSATQVRAAENKLVLGPSEKGDAGSGHRLFATADKALSGGGTLVGPDPGITVHVRGITGISAADDQGNTDRGTENVLKCGKAVKVQAALAGYNVDGLSIAEMGGVHIEITEGGEYLSETSFDFTAGTVSFKVKESIDFTAVPKPRVKFAFYPEKSGFQSVRCELSYVLEKNGDFVVEGGGPWKRNGELKLKITGVNPDWIWDGTNYFKGHIDICICFYDSATNMMSLEMTLNKNNIGNNTLVEFRPDYKNDFEITLFLRGSYNDFDFAQSYPYYGKPDDHFGASGLGEHASGADKVDITIRLEGKAEETITIDVEEVKYSWKRGEKEKWSNPVEPYRIYVTPEDKIPVRLYYKPVSGWEESDTAYVVQNRRFVGIIGEPSKGERLKDFSLAQSGVDGQKHYVDFSFGSSDVKEWAKQHETVTVVYEYNPTFGYQLDDEEASRRMQTVTGCEGKLEFCFVEPNLDNLYFYESFLYDMPSSRYCLEPQKLTGMLAEGKFYYIRDTERFRVSGEEITFEKLVSGIWQNQWGGNSMKWNRNTQTWEHW